MPIDWTSPNHGKIQCIKEVRQLVDVGLKEAKDAVEDVGDLMENHVTDQQIICAACHTIDPQRFPEGSSSWDYKMLWETLKGEYPEMARAMEVLEREHEAKLSKILARNKVAMLLSRTLNPAFNHITTGTESTLIYALRGDFTCIDLTKEELQEALRDAFNAWLDKAMADQAWR